LDWMGQRSYIKLVSQARRGDRASMDKLAGQVRGHLYAYVYRIVLRDDLAQDIVQESLLEMFKIFGNLEREDRFWPWLRGIAFNKIRRQYTKQQRRRTVPMSSIPEPALGAKSSEAGLANLVTEELKQIVLASMQKLKPQYRKVLSMRCYEEMEYSEIAELMGCSELSARVMFCRAKKSLQQHLSHNGLGRGALVMALVLFGKMTAPTEAAAANVSVTAATVKAGLAAGVLGMVGSKTAIVSLTTAGVLAAGAVVLPSVTDKRAENVSAEKSSTSLPAAGSMPGITSGSEELWYYYPLKAGGPIMMRLVAADSKAKQPCCTRLQNERANYSFDTRKNTVYIENARMWRTDLRVWPLPGDPDRMRRFISKVEGLHEGPEQVRLNSGGSLVIVKGHGHENGDVVEVTRHRSVLDEEFFIYSWPDGTRVVDNRDAMHRRGWTYFSLEGRVGQDEVSGRGRIPFVYSTCLEHSPWLELKVSGGLKVVDNRADACVYSSDGQMLARYERGSFFAGLARPWMGIHALDTVRRDAAAEQIWFETEQLDAAGSVRVTLRGARGNIVYTINLENDVIEQIEVSTGDGRKAELRFSYIQDVSDVRQEFVEPRIIGAFTLSKQQSPGVLWPIHLVEGGLGKEN